jgi:hypothetical protein
MTKINIDKILEIINSDNCIVDSIIVHKSIDKALALAIPTGTTSQTFVSESHMSDRASLDALRSASSTSTFANGKKVISYDEMTSLLEHSRKGEALLVEVGIFSKRHSYSYSLDEKAIFIYYKLSLKEKVAMDSHFNTLNVDNVVGDIL